MTQIPAPVAAPAATAAPRNLGGRPRDDSQTLEDVIIRELRQQSKQNDRLRSVAASIIKNIEKMVAGGIDSIDIQIRACDAIVGLMEASAKTIDTVAKHATRLREMSDGAAAPTGARSSDVKKLLGEHANV